MFGLQASSLMGKLRANGMSDQLASVLGNTFGQCDAQLQHEGPVTFTGPVKFSGPVEMGGRENNDPNTAGMPVRGVLMDDLIRDGFARLQVDRGPVVSVFGYIIKDASPAQAAKIGDRVIAIRCWGDSFFTAISGDNCLEDA